MTPFQKISLKLFKVCVNEKNWLPVFYSREHSIDFNASKTTDRIKLTFAEHPSFYCEMSAKNASQFIE